MGVIVSLKFTARHDGRAMSSLSSDCTSVSGHVSACRTHDTQPCKWTPRTHHTFGFTLSYQFRYIDSMLDDYDTIGEISSPSHFYNTSPIRSVSDRTAQDLSHYLTSIRHNDIEHLGDSIFV